MIYLVEDDESIRNMMMYTLEASGFEVKGFENGKSYFQAMLMNHPDLVMLDIMLPDMDGFVAVAACMPVVLPLML